MAGLQLGEGEPELAVLARLVGGPGDHGVDGHVLPERLVDADHELADRLVGDSTLIRISKNSPLRMISERMHRERATPFASARQSPRARGTRSGPARSPARRRRATEGWHAAARPPTVAECSSPMPSGARGAADRAHRLGRRVSKPPCQCRTISPCTGSLG